MVSSTSGSISPHAAYRTALKLRGPRPEAQDAWCVMNHLREDQVGHFGFEIPVDDRERSEVERSVRKHRDPDAAGDREDCSEHEPGDQCLFNAGDPLLGAVRQRKPRRGEQDDPSLGTRAGSEQLAKPLEQESPVYGLLSEAAARN